jgi:hypothetical protein
MSTFKKAFLATAVAAALTGTVMAGATESRLQSPHTAQLAQATGTQAPNVQGNRHATLAERLAKRHEHRMARLKEQPGAPSSSAWHPRCRRPPRAARPCVNAVNNGAN